MTTYCPNCMAQSVEGAPALCSECGSDIALENRPHQLPVMTILRGRYLVGRVLGEGGFGITYIGRDLVLDQRVAIKEYYPSGVCTRHGTVSLTVECATDTGDAILEKGRKQFLDEAKIIARFRDVPSIVNVNDFFFENGTSYIVMEYLDGQSLQQWLKENGPQKNFEAIYQMLQPVMAGLEKIHQAGLIHRDISPSNLMMTQSGEVKLLDFGAAREYLENENSISVILKPGYAPEEQYNKKGNQGPWTDVYALCATIYKLITGITPDNSVNRIFDDVLKKPSLLGAEITEAQEKVLLKGLAVKSDDRIKSMEELEKAFNGQLKFEEESAGDEKSSPVGVKRKSLALPILVAVAAIVAGAMFLMTDKKEPLPPDPAPIQTPTELVAVTTEMPATQAPAPTPSPIPSPEPSPEAVVVQNGSIGDFITWELDSDGLLSIEGTGQILDYNNTNRKAPWLAYAESIERIVISGDITNIPEYAFIGCSNLRDISIADSVTEVGMRSFSDCTSLEIIDIPDGVIHIGGGAFYNCTKLSDISLGSSLRKIRGYAFFGCSSLDHITLPGSLVEIEPYAFYGCSSLESIFFNGYPGRWNLVLIGDGNYPFGDTNVGTLTP